MSVNPRGGHNVIAVPVPPLDPFVRSRWEHYDPHLVSDDPAFTHAHVTLLSPWIDEPTPDDLAQIAEAASSLAPFDYDLSKVHVTPSGIVHLLPEPAAPFSRLTALLRAAFPQCVP
ncbi:hypothetical protein HNR19_000313 [Nocardioides thalensis]|uniref:2'-5' RNA ligase family protein n=1 Tax=Nocardioides thalensis TaxID=1914755 RepID=A0A853BWY2_9ACTN|nr:2'-5' RNA ligase family protein [Nocardioides thalensis]NYI99614.1 hypothetical protein [Nocardioides thalensis]